MRIWIYYQGLLKESRSWLKLVFLIFAAGALSGLLISIFFPQVSKMVIGSYYSSLDTSLRPGFGESLYIFRRNVFIVVLAIFSGFFFGLLPIFTAYVNGFILGILLGFRPLYQVVNGWQLFLLLAPHGIFEYAASFLGLSFGLRLGLNWLLPINKGKRLATFGKNLKEAFFIAILVVGLLFIAALIEGMLTQRIACYFGGICSRALQSGTY